MRKILLILALCALALSGCKKQAGGDILESSGQLASPGKTIAGYEGRVLAGEKSPFLDFRKGDYDKALASGKTVVLDFYANWCPICRAEEPELYGGFESLESDKIVGFRVNFNDSDTDSDEKELARQFGITYQHTKVIVRDDEVILKSSDSWTREDFAREIGRVL